MKDVFINTSNYQQFIKICTELQSSNGLIGPSMAMILGSSGRGKSEAARRFATENGAVYVSALPFPNPSTLIREITSKISYTRPWNTSECVELLEKLRPKKLILVDEADQLSIKALEMLRGLNERCAYPVLLLGEERLESKVTNHRRLASRIRRKMTFGPVTQGDLAIFYDEAFGFKLSPSVINILHKHCAGDWRPALVDAVAIEEAVLASGLNEVTEQLAKKVVNL